MRQRLSGDGCPAAHPARTAATRRGAGVGTGGQGGTRQTAAGAGGGCAGRLPKPHRAGVAGRQEAPQCAAVPGRRRAAAGRSPGTEKIGRLSRRHHRDSLMVSSLLAPPPFILS